MIPVLRTTSALPAEAVEEEEQQEQVQIRLVQFLERPSKLLRRLLMPSSSTISIQSLGKARTPSSSSTIANHINRYYVSWYYTYNIYISRTTVDTTRVTKYTTVSIYATAAAEADASFTALSATMSLPTPAAATAIPTIPTATATATEVAGGSTGLSTSGTEKAAKWSPVFSVSMIVAVIIALAPLLLAVRL